ncbi:hypothetical protein [Mycolicibacterium fortuitum]|jgi:hypothetical protein|uniref:Uncharacterized protein n=3 Tax=Mycolicibacterium fortuitum TaxID=1766 RepID=A0A0N9YIG6_MYCFO|nr:hypothetical protein [Mycolicibacterium fortuitum]AIY48669.1 hypothetical protein G155_27610 [Mycobacterium sp. VKM Ac-1817D]CRL72123.1 hypothetical protein CPGR_00818 [Mycolicibacter nonchromogenicus]ALI29370.1 hypothetical protein XA26_55800 [Mycolicibacterium fortuitum]AMD56010.1 hypothetical protein ATO49_26250 [Mycolicibacterium fortuitum subsp. fortuitum DSM 46621 = ATCC 6841 = JCM 6387]EJZ09119.1 hypothetical protein MFORT_23262 [Mycolicibacterium fortuitum subsp. fortuitum DSM 46621
MTVPLGVTPSELRNTAQYLAYVSNDMKAVQSALMQMLSGEGEAWGHDKIGRQFADGGKGYKSQRDWVDGSITAKTDLLDYYADGLYLTADALEQQDKP